MVNICLAVLIGLPASGKSSLTKVLVESLHELFVILPVVYDNLIPLELQEELSLKSTDATATWKGTRKVIVCSVENAICRVLGKGVHSNESIETVSCTELTRKILNEWHETGNLDSKTVSCDENTNMIIVIDDNMYYRSMRYEYYQLARTHNLSFCQLYVECSTRVAVKRNQTRDTKVPESVIVLMQKKLEPPDPVQFKWESHSLKIVSDDCLKTVVSSSVVDLFNVALSNPVPPLDDTSEDQAISRTVNLTNIIHQVDLTLRKLISTKMKNGKDLVTKQELGKMGKVLNEKKTRVLESIRNGTLVLPQYIVDGIESQDESSITDLNNYLVSVFVVDEN